MWFVYIARCADGSLYTGITTNLDRRLQEHNAGEGGAYTRSKRPVRLVFQEAHPSRSSALTREVELKSWPRSNKEALLLSLNPALPEMVPSLQMKYSSAFGEFFKARRQALGLALREFCLTHKLDPGNISRLERGLLPPPRNGGRLEEYAKCLALKKDNGDWHTFFDLAAVSKGRIPAELMEDEDLVATLPVIFRALRGKRFTNKRLDDLVRKVHAR